jgi:hypothetical protein
VDYMMRPTQVMVRFMLTAGLKPPMEFHLGRTAMALEVLTVIKTLEDDRVPMLALQREETISVLTTLLLDQDLWESATEWYEKLAEWQRVKLVADVEGGAGASVRGVPPDDAAPVGRIDARLGLRRSLVLPSDGSEQPTNGATESTPTE